MNNTKYIPVRFKGAQYMCVEGSKRAEVLNRAHAAWLVGDQELTSLLFDEANHADGCAFAHREHFESEHARYSDLQSYRNLYN